MAYTKEQIADLYAQLDAAAVSRSTATADPVTKFVKTARKQIEKVDELLSAMEDGRDIDQDLVPQSDWFFREGKGWAVKFGRAKIKTPNGTDWFEAPDLTAVKRFLDVAIKLAQNDADFQQKIKDVSAENKKKFEERGGVAPKRATSKKK